MVREEGRSINRIESHFLRARIEGERFPQPGPRRGRKEKGKKRSVCNFGSLGRRKGKKKKEKECARRCGSSLTNATWKTISLVGIEGRREEKGSYPADLGLLVRKKRTLIVPSLGEKGGKKKKDRGQKKVMQKALSFLLVPIAFFLPMEGKKEKMGKRSSNNFRKKTIVPGLGVECPRKKKSKVNRVGTGWVRCFTRRFASIPKSVEGKGKGGEITTSDTMRENWARKI